MENDIPKLVFRPDVTVKTNDGDWIVRHRTLDDYQRTLALAIERGGKTLPGASDHASYGQRGVGAHWYGTSSAKQYADMLRNGWPEGIQGAEGLDGLCTDAVDRLQIHRNVAGSFANVPAYLAGHPAAMYEMRISQSDKRGVSLVFDTSFSCGVTGDTVLRYARKVMQLVAWLQTQQIETAVYGMQTVTLGATHYCYPITIREHGQILQPERIAAILHPSWLRRAWFSMLEYDAHQGCPHAKRATSFGYGYPATGNAELFRQILPEAYAVIILPKPGKGDPRKAVEDALNLKLRRD